MKSMGAAIVMLATLTASAAEPQATAQALTQKVQEGCQTEINMYCKTVAPGEGRVFACLYAHSDKLSGRCESALYDAAEQLEAAATKLNHVANSCSADLKQYCAEIKPGEGRVANCMRKNQAKLTPTCQQAMKDTRMTAK